MPIILALLLNELRFQRYKKVSQTVLYLPHFLSWVIIASVALNLFKPQTGLVNILMMNSGVNKELIEWFSKAINSLIDQHFPIEGFSNEKIILSRSYAISIFAGMREIFRRTTIEKDQLKMLVKTYLNSYIVMLDSDIRKLVK